MVSEYPKAMNTDGDKDLSNVCVEVSEKQSEFLEIWSTVLEGLATKYIFF